jgi:hypothetical protein
LPNGYTTTVRNTPLTYADNKGWGIGVANLYRGNAPLLLLVAATMLGYGQGAAHEGDPKPAGPDKLFTALITPNKVRSVISPRSGLQKA